MWFVVFLYLSTKNGKTNYSHRITEIYLHTDTRRLRDEILTHHPRNQKKRKKRCSHIKDEIIVIPVIHKGR